jgi:hypothetical protein
MMDQFIKKTDNLLLRIQSVLDISDSNVMYYRSKLASIKLDEQIYTALILFKTCYQIECQIGYVNKILEIYSKAFLMDNNASLQLSISHIASSQLHDDIKAAMILGKKIVSEYNAHLAELYAKATKSMMQENNRDIDIFSIYKKYPSSTLALSFPLYVEDRIKMRMLIMSRCVGYNGIADTYYNSLISSKFIIGRPISYKDINDGKIIIHELGSAIYKSPQGRVTSVTPKSIKDTETIVRRKHEPPKLMRFKKGRESPAQISGFALNPIYYDGEEYRTTRGIAGYPYMVPNEFTIRGSKFFDDIIITPPEIQAREYTSISYIKRDLLNDISNSTSITTVMSRFNKIMTNALKQFITNNSIPDYLQDEVTLSFIGMLAGKNRQLQREVKKRMAVKKDIKLATQCSIDTLFGDSNNIFDVLEYKRRLY